MTTAAIATAESRAARLPIAAAIRRTASASSALAAETPDKALFYPLEDKVRARYLREAGLTAEPATLTDYLRTVVDGTWKKFVKGSGEVGFYTGRIKCGTESNGGFRNIAISNCVFEGCQGLALETVDGALLEDIAISNITMRDIVSCPLFFRLGARLRGPKETTKVGTLRRVLVSNVVSYNTASRISSILSGIPGYAIEDVKIANMYVQHVGGAASDTLEIVPPELEVKYPEPGMFGPMPAQGFFIRHLQHLEMSHVEVQPASPDPRPAFYLQDVQRADFIAVTAPTGQSAFSLHDVTDLRVLISRAAPDTTLAKVDSRQL